MEFPHSYYEDELISDYVVPSMVKRTWAAQTQILADLDSACQKHGIGYFAEWGTLLGTVRHGGFVPWDDDLDICMKRKDYDRFVRDARSILPDNYHIVNYRSSRDFNHMLSRIVSSDHYRFDPEYMHKYSGLPFALGIDIFPLDYMTDDEEYEKERQSRVNLVYDAVNEIAVFATPPSNIEDHIKKIERTCRVNINRKGDVLTQLRELLEKLFGEVEEKDAKYVTIYPLWLNYGFQMPAKYYEKIIRMPFETTTIPVPVYYDSLLEYKFGSTYMSPVRSGGTHEYPYFERHVDVLREHFGYEWPTYRFDPKDLSEGRQEAGGSGGKCVFITYSAKAFENMRSLVRDHVERGYDVTVMPIQRFDIAADMTGIEAADEVMPDDFYTEGLPDVRVTQDRSVLERHPDVIVTNYPFDEFNMITAVDKAYYSKALKNLTDRLVYVPPYEAASIEEDDERAIKLMPYYVNTPLAAVCDEIVLHSEQMKERYAECLTGFSGEKYRSAWENKIRVFDDKNEKVRPQKGEKSRVMFFIGIGIFAEHGEEAIEKIRSVFDIFEENSEKVEMVYAAQEGLFDNLKEMYPGLYERYEKEGFCRAGENVPADDIDAYYGEPSPYVSQFYDRQKPVMIMKVR